MDWLPAHEHFLPHKNNQPIELAQGTGDDQQLDHSVRVCYGLQ